jgi:phage baseplate assembly protein W
MAEKKLYKDVVVAKGTLRTALPTQRAYRGTSTVNNDNTKFGLFDIGLIKQDIINHFHISKGEKLENPNFGTIIWDVIQDPLTSELEEAIEQDVLDIINTDPRVSATTVQIVPFESGLQIEVELEYLTYNVSEKLRLTFDERIGIPN